MLLVLMDSAFQLEGIARDNFFQAVMHTFGYTYICLWSYSHQSNCLVFLDGRYHEETNQPSSSSGTLARRLFDCYCQSFFPIVEYDCVPGLAFKYGQQYIEVNQSELLILASSEPQRLFYKEARIKTAVFMACKTGEIELGLSRGSQTNMEAEMRNLFQKDFTNQQSPLPAAASEVPLTAGADATGLPPSSSSSLRSLSIDSPLQPLIANISTSASTTTPIQQAMQAFSQLPYIQLPITQETEHDALTRAILAVLTSPTSSSSSSQQPQKKASAFKRYNLALAPTSNIRPSNLQAQSMMKRAISYYRRLSMAMARREYPDVESSRAPTITKLHHKISERKRREKLNEIFQALRSLLPPGIKKDKASLLISTRDYLSYLKAQIEELSRRNQILEAQVLPAAPNKASASVNDSINQRVQVRVTPVSESTSEWRIIDVGVTVRGECPMLDLVTRILEFLKRDDNLSLISVEANTQIADSTSFNRVILRLRIQGNEWDESAFVEALRRIVADVAQ